MAKIDWDEISKWSVIALPMSLSFLSRTGMMLTDISFLGHWDSDYLSTAGISSTWCSLTYTIVGQGILVPIVTLGAQAYGAKQYHLVGIWHQIGLTLGMIASIFIIILCCFGGTLFQPLAGYDDEQRDKVNSFCRYLSIGVPFLTIFTAQTNYLLAVGITKPQLIANVIGVFVNILLNYLFLYVFDLGFTGSPLATSVTRIILCITLMVYVHYKDVLKQTQVSFSFKNMTHESRTLTYIKQALPETLSSVLEDWQLQTISIFAARLGDLEVSTNNALFSIFFVLSSFMMALCNATQVRMAFHLGNGDIPKAKMVMKFSTVIAFCIGAVVALFFILARAKIGHIFSNDPEVWKLADEVSTLCGCGYLALVIFYISMATLSAQGRPAFIAISFLIGAWGVSVPAAYIFAFHVDATHGLLGLWVGLTLGYAIGMFRFYHPFVECIYIHILIYACYLYMSN